MFKLSVLLPLAVNRAFTYFASEPHPEGTFVDVSFRNKDIVGIVVPEEKCDIPDHKIKEINKIFDQAPLSLKMIDFIYRVAQYNCAMKGQVLKMVIGRYQPKKHSISNVDLSLQNIVLSEEQQRVVNAIALDKPKVHVIDGVTGSGKTEVYLKLAQDVLRKDGQVLILTPEILLTTQLEKRFREKIGDLHSWHSSVSIAKKRKIWHDCRDGVARLIVGARSALFIPFANLKLIIVDEEHDTSFKQEDGVIYNGRDMAVMRGHVEKIPVILASATPSMETVQNARSAIYTMHHLRNRHGGVLMPSVKIVDMARVSKNMTQREENDSAHPRLVLQRVLHSYSEERIKYALSVKKQVLIFINRRGYAPIIYCRSCGSKMKCIQCESCLVYHKGRNVMQCHHCDYKITRTDTCCDCGEIGSLLLYGCGVEQAEEQFHEIFPDAKIAVITSENMGSHKQATDMVESIAKNEVDIIIGTQIVAKGLNFLNLHLVIVLDANPSYMSSDIRIMERSYQLLYQVMGRAGRASTQGEVVLQSIDPEDKLLNCIAKYEKENFIDLELKNREIASAPPFSRMISLTCQAYDEAKLLKGVNELRAAIPKIDGDVQIFGPAPCPMKVLRGYYRYRFIVRGKRTLNLQALVAQWLQSCNISSLIKIKVDVDPQSFI